jgi:hypothetical protein
VTVTSHTRLPAKFVHCACAVKLLARARVGCVVMRIFGTLEGSYCVANVFKAHKFSQMCSLNILWKHFLLIKGVISQRNMQENFRELSF